MAALSSRLKHGDTSRRRFLKATLSGAAGALVFAAVEESEAAIEEIPSLVKNPAGKGYRETDHVRRYYDTLKP